MNKQYLIHFIDALIFILLLSFCNQKNASQQERNGSDPLKQKELEILNKPIYSNSYKDKTDTNYKGVMMINEQLALCILDSTSPQNASNRMEENYQKILKDVDLLKVAVAEQPGCIFYHTSSDKIVFETFMLLKNTPKKKPQFSKPVILEKTLALLYDHYGTFNSIHKSYNNIRKILEESSYQQTGPAREIYILNEDTAKWRTRIIVPVTKK